MKCNKCGRKIIKFPLWKGQEDGEPFDWSKVIWLNWFKVDMMYIISFAILMILVISYKADIETCEEIVTDPLGYCEESNACKIIEERKPNELGYIVPSENILKIDEG